MGKVSDREREILERSGFWELIKTDLELYENGLLNKEQFQHSVFIASRLHKEQLAESIVKHFKEISVERINIVEQDGSLKMVISNSKRQYSGSVDGYTMPQRERPAGLIFINSDGDECGGLIYDGNKESAGLVLSVDKYKDDQIMQLKYEEDCLSKKQKYGLQIWDYPLENGFRERMKRFMEFSAATEESTKKLLWQKMREDGLLAEDRLFLGKTAENSVGLFIRDRNGRERIRIYIDEDNRAQLEFLDENGDLLRVDKND